MFFCISFLPSWYMLAMVSSSGRLTSPLWTWQQSVRIFFHVYSHFWHFDLDNSCISLYIPACARESLVRQSAHRLIYDSHLKGTDHNYPNLRYTKFTSIKKFNKLIFFIINERWIEVFFNKGHGLAPSWSNKKQSFGPVAITKLCLTFGCCTKIGPTPSSNIHFIKTILRTYVKKGPLTYLIWGRIM